MLEEQNQELTSVDLAEVIQQKEEQLERLNEQAQEQAGKAGYSKAMRFTHGSPEFQERNRK